jgi:hypothetical protein
MQMDPSNPILPANRAMALLKQGMAAAAEADCTIALRFLIAFKRFTIVTILNLVVLLQPRFYLCQGISQKSKCQSLVEAL